MLKITKAQGEGQGQCRLCKQRGIFNRQWMCFLYKIEGKEGVYCEQCKNEIKAQEFCKGDLNECDKQNHFSVPE